MVNDIFSFCLEVARRPQAYWPHVAEWKPIPLPRNVFPQITSPLCSFCVLQICFQSGGGSSCMAYMISMLSRCRFLDKCKRAKGVWHSSAITSSSGNTMFRQMHTLHLYLGHKAQGGTSIGDGPDGPTSMMAVGLDDASIASRRKGQEGKGGTKERKGRMQGLGPNGYGFMYSTATHRLSWDGHC